VEEEYFRLVPTFNNVREAVFYLNPDSTLNVFVSYEYDGVINDTLIVNYILLVKLRNYIDRQLAQEINDARNIERGKYVNVFTERDSVIAGELLVVSDTSIMVLNLERETYNQANAPPFDVRNVYNTEISKLIVIEGTNLANLIYPILGIGVLGGIAAKIAIDKNQSEEPKDLSEGIVIDFTPLLYAMLGDAIGALIGRGLSEIFPITSVSEIEYNTPFNEEDIEGLRRVTRYKEE
jgi:hypothetical protein